MNNSIKRISVFASLACLLVFSGCSMLGLGNPKPNAAATKATGGGKAQASATAAPINTTVPGAQNPAAETAQPAAGATQPAAVTAQPGAQATAQPAAGTQPTPQNGQVVQLKGAKQGVAVNRGKLVVTLTRVEATSAHTLIDIQVSGLPKNYKPTGGFGEPTLVTPGGKVLQVTRSQGGGGQGIENAEYEFPPLTAGAKSFTLMVPNSWTGKVETWKIPVSLQ